MAQTSRTVKIDENVLRYNQVKMPGKMAVEVGAQRRPALGELGNRVKNPNTAAGDLLAGKKAALKEIKPRVDSHWKKESSNLIAKTLTRTDSIKLGGLAATRPANATNAQLGQPRLVRTRTLQTARPEVAQRVGVPRQRSENDTKPTAAATMAATAAAAAIAARTVSSGTAAVTMRNAKALTNAVVAAATAAAAVEQRPTTGVQQVRRQESNLTRRSLTKLRAAIQKDKQQKLQNGGESGAPSSSVGSSLESLDDAKAVQQAEPQQGHSTISIIDIENIDGNDDDNLILCSEYVNDIYNYLYALERATPIRENYLHDQKEVTHKMRGVLVDWLNEVHMQFTLVQETFFMAVAIIDRYLQVVKTTTRQNLQLVGVTALFMASKYEELYPPEIRDFVYITDDTYDKKQILDMERHISKQLEFNMGRPLPIHFLRRFAKAAHSANFSDNVYLMSKYFIELAAVDYSMVQYYPSEIAGASLLLALRLMDTGCAGGESVWNKTIQYYTTYREESLVPIVRRLALVVKDAPTSRLRAVYNKYKQMKLGQISTHPQLTANDSLEQVIASCTPHADSTDSDA